jgi:uncharacterized protein YaaN involved in tellurite resistance
MNKDTSPYQRVHETMSTIAKGVGKNTTDIKLNEKSLEELWLANQNTINALEKINSVLDSNTELHRLHAQHIAKHQLQIQELSEEIRHTKRALLIYIWVVIVINLGFLVYSIM